jgi:hypothetical protein
VNVIAKLVAVATGSVLVAVVSAVPASARVLEHDHFNDSGTEPVPQACQRNGAFKPPKM